MLSPRRLRPRLTKHYLAYQKEKGDEWKTISVWAMCQAEAKNEFRKKIGIDLDEQAYDYVFLNP